MNNITISGMIGANSTFFARCPVVVNVNNLSFPPDSPIKVVRLEVLYEDAVAGTFTAEAGGSDNLDFDISSALRAIWTDDNVESIVASAETPITSTSAPSMPTRAARAYKLKAYRDFIDSTDGEYTTDESDEFDGGYCLPGGLTEWERFEANDSDVSVLENSNLHFGDASTKPAGSPERVGKDSITSWVDISAEGITSYFFAPGASSVQIGGITIPAPQVLRDSVAYTDFLFLNRRGAVEACSAVMLESLDIDVETTQYTRTGRPSFTPERSIMSVATGGRRSWAMSSGYQTREWAEWWTLEFLMAKRRWMRYKGKFVPVTVVASKNSVGIYDKTKQQMPHVDFTVTLALEG